MSIGYFTLAAVLENEAGRIAPELSRRLSVDTENIESEEICFDDLRQESDVKRCLGMLMDDLVTKMEQRPDLHPVKSSMIMTQDRGIRKIRFVIQCSKRVLKPELVPA